MKILGIDTTTKFLCLGIYDNAKVYTYNLEVGTRLSLLLCVTLKRTLDALSLRINDIDYFACGLGPGSFTGIRIGLSTIKGFCFALKRPLLGLPTLDILARSVRRDNGYIVPVIDAKRGLIYCSIYRIKFDNLKRISPYMLLSKEALFKKLRQPAVIFGDALSKYRDDFLKDIKGVTVLDQDYWYPKAHNMIALALEKIKHKQFNNAFDIKPIYLYPKECQIRKR